MARRTQRERRRHPAAAAEERGGKKRRFSLPIPIRLPSSRYNRTKGRYRTLYSMVAAVLTAVAVIVGTGIFFRVETVTANSGSDYTAEEIVKIAGIDKGSSLFLINKSKVADRITTKLPYLATAEITRQLPGTVSITVSDCEASAAFMVSNGYWYVDEDGKLLKLSTDPGDLLIVSGLSLDTPTVGADVTVDTATRLKKNTVLDLIRALNDQELMEDAISCDCSDGSCMILQYTDKYRVEIPYGSDVDYKIRAMKGIVDELTKEKDEQSGTINLTLESEWHFIPD